MQLTKLAGAHVRAALVIPSSVRAAPRRVLLSFRSQKTIAGTGVILRLLLSRTGESRRDAPDLVRVD
jgi:hypothetical protein